MRIGTAAAVLVLATTLGILPAAADRYCSVPLSDWQPREALQRKLEAEGWTVLKIRSDDGCYKVLARDGRGDTVKAKFDPATLERVGRDRDHHGRHDDETD